MSLITLDFETFYSRDFSLSKMTTEQYIRDPKFEVIGFAYKVDDGESVWVTGDDKHIADALASLELHKHYLICHNMAFDGAILAWRYGIIPKYYIDTLSMARPVTQATVGGSLKKLAEFFHLGEKGTEVVNAMGLRRNDFPPEQLAQYGEYCKNDADITYLLYRVLKQFSTPHEMYIIDMTIRMFTDPVVELDAHLLSDHLAAVRDRKAIVLEKCGLIKDELMSNPKFAAALETLGVVPPRKTSLATGKETWAFGKTDPEFKALLEHDNPDVQAIMAARFALRSTLEETRTESFIGIARRGALPIMLNYYGAHTGRASGADKMNLQNLPRGGALRESMCAPEGYKLVACDSAQIEARVVAWLAGQDDLVEGFARGEDIYSAFATLLYGYPVSKATKVERHVGKMGILGLGFGMGKDKFKASLKSSAIPVDVELDEAERIVKLYRSTYPTIVALWKQADNAIKSMAKGHEYWFGTGIMLKCDSDGVHLPNGMIVRYKNLRHNAAENCYEYDGRYGPIKLYGAKLVENVVQALARIVVFNQMATIDKKLRTFDSPATRFKLVLTVHDEVVCLVPTKVAEKFAAFMVKVMSKPPNWGPDLPIACEVAYAQNYMECK